MTVRSVVGEAWTWARPGCFCAAESAGSSAALRPGPDRVGALGATRARFTRDFEDVVTWLAQRMDKTAITRLLRCSWQAVANIVTRVVADHIDDDRLNDVYRIGVDEVSYRKGHRYLTVVADHDRDGAVIWAGEGKSGATLERFFDELGPQRSKQITAASACTARRPRITEHPKRPGVRRPVPRDQTGQPRRRRGPSHRVEHRPHGPRR